MTTQLTCTRPPSVRAAAITVAKTTTRSIPAPPMSRRNAKNGHSPRYAHERAQKTLTHARVKDHMNSLPSPAWYLYRPVNTADGVGVLRFGQNNKAKGIDADFDVL